MLAGFEQGFGYVLADVAAGLGVEKDGRSAAELDLRIAGGQRWG